MRTNMKKLKKYTFRAERNRTCLLCGAIAAALAAIVAVCWVLAPVPVAGAMTGIAGFLVLWLSILAVSWARYARRFYALARDNAFPTVALGESLNVCFYACAPQDVAAYMREMQALAPLPARHTREEWLAYGKRRDEIGKAALGGAKTIAYPSAFFGDVAALCGKKLLLSRNTYNAFRAQFDYSPVRANNELLFTEDFFQS